MSRAVEINDNTPEVLRVVKKMSFDTLIEFTQIAHEITTELAPVRKNTTRMKDGKKITTKGGNHRSLIETKKVRDGHTRLFSQSGYGVYLEFGTSKMAARPHFSKGIQAAINQFKNERRWKT